MHATISPFLWYDSGAEDAANFYISLFPNSEIVSVHRAEEGAPATFVTFTLNGLPVMAMNAGPQFPHTAAFSFFVRVKDQAEIDSLWEALIADGGEESMCGWLKDRWGLSWQIIPEGFENLVGGPDPAKAASATRAMMSMRKIDFAALKAAYDAG